MRKIRLFSLVLVVVLLVSLTGCGDINEKYIKAFDEVGFEEAEQDEKVSADEVMNGFYQVLTDEENIEFIFGFYFNSKDISSYMDDINEVLYARNEEMKGGARSSFSVFIFDMTDKDIALDFYEGFVDDYEEFADFCDDKDYDYEMIENKSDYMLIYDNNGSINASDIILKNNKVILISYHEFGGGVKNIKKTYKNFYEEIKRECPLDIL